MIVGRPIDCGALPEAKLGRPLLGDAPMTATHRKRRTRERRGAERIENIAILDMETDPFDNANLSEIRPFLAVLYSDNFETVVIWEENQDAFTNRLISAIEGLPGKYTIFAHNGGKFDYLFLLHRLRGFVSFKGRGIMSAKIGEHELRDSFHIIPERLANWKKDDFDYSKLTKSRRNALKKETIEYCISDCRYLLEIVKKFIADFGFKISIGQAAMARLKEHYKVECLGDKTDEFLRQWFFGGRVECLAGRGHFTGGGWKLFDVNSMYPKAMADYQHPISNTFLRRPGKPNYKTVFLDLTCTNYGALVRRGENGETSATEKDGRFLTTIWEYNVAIKYGLISNVKIIDCLDFEKRSDFARFVHPLYNQRLSTKAELQRLTANGLKEGNALFDDAKKDDIFLKLILNNAYGKFAQNPRRFKEHYLTDHGERPPTEAGDGFDMLPNFECGSYDIWTRPNPSIHFNNVATAASITGAARGILMEAIQNADEPIYCDTDSLICRDLRNVEIDKVKLGAWDLEKEIDEIIINGKKLYIYRDNHGKVIVRSKGTALGYKPGISTLFDGELAWQQMLKILDDDIIAILNRAPTLNKLGTQHYMTRNIRATVPRRRQHASIYERLIA